MHGAVLLDLQLLVAALLTGLIWTVQVAVYPHFARILSVAGPEAFRTYHADYTRSMGWVAAPLMIAELGLAALWLVTSPSPRGPELWLSLASVVLVWLHTFGWMVPLHARLQAAPTLRDARRLTRLNWLRSGLWTARLVALVFWSGRGVG